MGEHGKILRLVCEGYCAREEAFDQSIESILSIRRIDFSPDERSDIQLDSARAARLFAENPPG
jgi:hypothetical protein